MEKEAIRQTLSAYNALIKENDELYRGLAKGLGLSECRFWILYTLRTEYAPPIQSEICACLYQPKQTVNSALKKLEEEGCIRLVPGPDRRSKRIGLTPKGEALCAKTVDRVIAMEQTAFAALSPEERGEFLRLFRRYTNLLREQKEKTLEDS